MSPSASSSLSPSDVHLESSLDHKNEKESSNDVLRGTEGTVRTSFSSISTGDDERISLGSVMRERGRVVIGAGERTSGLSYSYSRAKAR